MKKCILPLLFAAMTTTVFTSCLGDGNNEQTAQITATMVQLRKDANGTELTTANYRYNINYTDGIIDITIYDEDSYGAAFVLEDVPMTYSEDLGYTFRATDITPTTATGEAITDLHITNLYGQYAGPTLDLRYTINGNTSILAIPESSTYYFTDIVTAAADGASYEYGESYVNLKYRINADSALVDMTLYNIRFVSEMPVMESMTFPSIEVAPSPSGDAIMLTADEIIPKISNTPYPSHKATNFTGSLNPAFSTTSFFSYENLRATFSCMEMNVRINADMYITSDK